MIDFVTSERIEEVERIIRMAHTDEKNVNIHTIFSGLSNLSQLYSQKVYEEIGKLGLICAQGQGWGT